MSVRRLLISCLFAPTVFAANDTSADTTLNQIPFALDPFVVTSQLDKARDDIVPSLGATTFVITSSQIEFQPLGDNAPFSQVILQAPGVAQDSAVNGDLHVRGEHGNLQYRINDVVLPEGITGFGLELDPRFVDSMQLITGSLPAQYGFRTAGIVDIHTKGGALANSGEAEVFGGSFDTLREGFETGGSVGTATCFVDGSFDHNSLGIENPTASATPVHDLTDQSKLFGYLSEVLDDKSRISLMGSASYSNFQVPNTPGLSPGTSPNGTPWLPGSFDSGRLNERQNEQNYFGVAAYQKSAGDLNLQVAGYGRYSSVHFLPDPIGDLYFNGVASDVARTINSGGLQIDASDLVHEFHTVRVGAMLLDEHLGANNNTTVFRVDAAGNPTGPSYPVVENGAEHALFFGLYAQDEWKLATDLTLNYGARFDLYSSSSDREDQVSPRVNLIYQIAAATTFHAGYARYFTPPPLENVSATTVAQFNGTSNASAVTQDDPVKAERADYFDVGISDQLATGLQVGADGYYKTARNQLDDGLFGQSLILSAFNYRDGKIDGIELTGSYTKGGLSLYGNLARSRALGRGWDSAQFLFSPGQLAYLQNHWIHLDHDQDLSATAGLNYTWKESRGSTRVYLVSLYGSGLRTDATDNSGNVIPNGGHVPGYDTFNLGAEQDIRLKARRTLKLRLDVINLLDRTYELRDGSGVGVNAAQFGERRGLFGSVGLTF